MNIKSILLLLTLAGGALSPAPAASERNKYIQKAELNGQPLNTPFITHDQIMSGGTLRLELGEKPNRNWGVN